MVQLMGLLPIRKVNPSKVALTSYYNKLMVSRSEKRNYHYAQWLHRQVLLISTEENSKISHLMLSDVHDSSVHVPRIYSTLGGRFRSFQYEDLELFFDYQAREVQFGAKAIETLEHDGMVVVGRKGKRNVVVDKNDIFYLINEKNALEPMGSIESIMGLSGSPIDMAELRLFGKQLPVGLVLGYHLGLSALIELLGVTPRRVMTGTRLGLADDEYALRFEDLTLVFNKEDRLAAQILSGYLGSENVTRNYPLHLFDRKDIYFNMLDRLKIGVRYLREVDLMMEMFIDPITRELLVEMGEPTDMVGLLLRACELLLTDWSLDETDLSQMRIKGYERISGAVYSELVRAIRSQRARAASNARIDMPPFAVWTLIQEDPSLRIVEESNPIHNLKEVEEITYSGVGGRSDRSMVARTRVFHPSDLGVVSEATKDSASVAITTFMTPDPNLKNLRGVTEPYAPGEDGPTTLVSTSALTAPAADRDDPERVNFISIQHSSSLFAKGYQVNPLRTGYERVLAHRTEDTFATTAKQPGKVTKVTKRSVEVTFEDQSVKVIELGRRYGEIAGVTFPHEIVTDLKEGDTVKVGDCIAYNKHYFTPDALDPTQTLWKSGILVKTAIMESANTLEDSSSITRRVAELMETQHAHLRDILVRFDDTVRDLVEVGNSVEVESILCVLEDSISARNKLLDDETVQTLHRIASNAPKAKYKGVVERIEVFYHGEIEDMSESLQELATASDRDRKRLARDLRRNYTSGRTDGSMRVEKDRLPFDHAVIRVFITGPESTGVGDKGVFGNQMKTTFGKIIEGVFETESGTTLDAMFGAQSISNRQVLSPMIMGTTITLQKVISKRVVDVYRGKLK